MKRSAQIMTRLTTEAYQSYRRIQLRSQFPCAQRADDRNRMPRREFIAEVHDDALGAAGLKRLHHLNYLHAEMAVVPCTGVQPKYRITKTCSAITKLITVAPIETTPQPFSVNGSRA